ncbi:YagK/YfjJ domain-containing protein [Burkholderia pseudomallei]|uniref:YagK/YfjJ domain-containing protein n=1 Tax=Burkholderia pseudomallei TaxID=28450 RepID=UPI0005E0691D|nr:inovirus-type Gp2 protein [Burkholderia pseudomallei]CPI08152.1 Protein of uncharacterised function (DUF3296) [Burkholderia pseudomallei]
MDKSTRILRPGESPFIAPRASYAWYDRDHVLRSHVLHVDLDESQQLIREIAEDFRDGAADYTPWVMLSQRVIEAENFVRAILASEDTGFEDKRDDQGRLTELVCLSLGHYYFSTLMSGKFLTDIDTLEPYRLRPMAQVYFDVRHGPQFGHCGTQYFKAQPWFRLNDEEPFRFEMFNEVVHAVRAEAEARNLDRLDEWNESQAKQRFKAMMRHVHWCFRKRRRIFVIRMDLYYRSEFAGNVSIEQVKEHHALFVNRLRALKDIRANLVGGIWKLKWTQRKGHHLHWVFMFDGSLVQDAWKWSKLIDEEWRKAAPRDSGYTHCGNYDEHRKVGVGMIHIDNDPEKFEVFQEKVIDYLAKKDQALCLKITDGTRAWGRFTPGGKRVSNAGRPPKSGGGQTA